MAVLWYGLVPMAGAAIMRRKWYKFRKRFLELSMSPFLDYRAYWRKNSCAPDRQTPKGPDEGDSAFRFTGSFESVTDGQTLWVRSEDLTVPVSLEKAETYLLPAQKNDEGQGIFDLGGDTPEKIRWGKISALTEGAKVFVGGLLVCRDGRMCFASAKQNPLTVIFYDGPDNTLVSRAVSSCRHRGEYWNAVTPYSLVTGAICQILMALFYLYRPAYRLTVIVSLVALFIPLYPIIPPGLLFTIIYSRIGLRSRVLRACGDLARMPMRYLELLKDKHRKNQTRRKEEILPGEGYPLPGGEMYGFLRYAEYPVQALEENIPLLLPDFAGGKGNGFWHIFGVLCPGEMLPLKPQDPFSAYGVLPGRPETLAKRFTAAAYILETLAWIVLLTGIGLNILFLRMILVLL
ncbi:MAG: hypothetical protein FWH38_03125 [Treponema sp.]|nr:hypothetical protein [Treponema sp.]